jgi:hypothetical protein
MLNDADRRHFLLDNQVDLILAPTHAVAERREAHIGELIRFIPKSELERTCLIREARAIYDSIFPPAEPVSEQRETPKP